MQLRTTSFRSVPYVAVALGSGEGIGVGRIAYYGRVSGQYTIKFINAIGPMILKLGQFVQCVAITMRGLQSYPGLHDQQGTVTWFDERQGHYHVRPEGLESTLFLKPSSVILPNGTVTRIVGQQTTEQALNRVYGTIKAWKSESNRYEVQLKGKRVSISMAALRM